MTGFRVDAGLRGKNVVVTGAARGIGRATAELFAASGARVCAVDYHDDVREVVAGLPGQGHQATVADLTNPALHEEILRGAECATGSLDVLAHVAAVIRRKDRLSEVSEADWDLQLDVNLKATFFLDRAAAEMMRAEGRGGRIINFASQGWWTGGYDGSVVYSASKGGVVALCRGLARTYGPDGILVNTVAPGLVDTPMLHDDVPPEKIDALVRACPLGRIARPEEIAGAVVFLASDHASYISGATLNVSGALLMY